MEKYTTLSPISRRTLVLTLGLGVVHYPMSPATLQT